VAAVFSAFFVFFCGNFGWPQKNARNAKDLMKTIGIDVKQQHPLSVYDVDDCLVVELKASRAVADEYVAQILGYLKAARIEDGLLINFGSYKFEIKKYIMSHDKARIG
jgi:hypothetical protein